MRKNFLIAFVIGVACIALAVAGIFYMQRGAHLALPGKVLKVRTAPLDERSSVAVIDFRISNPSDYPAVVRTVTVRIEKKEGGSVDGQTISEMDAQRVFAGVPLLGPKYNPSLVIQDKIPGRSTWDRMIAARFEIPEDQLANRARIVISIEEIDGKVFEIAGA